VDHIRAGNRTFYDDVGWQKAEGGQFTDSALFEDLRPVSAEYIHRCHLRVNRYLSPTGRFLVDAASGPVQFPEYLTYSEGYDKRICVDFSFRALVEARKTVGDRGAYVLADITKLPLRDGAADAVVSINTIYHVPEDEQAEAFNELHRVLAPGRTAVVVYAWHHSVLMRLFEIPMRAVRLLARLAGRRSAGPTVPLYFRPKGHRWFVRRPWPFRYRIAVWRAVSVPFLEFYGRARLGGRRLLSFVFWLEERMPGLMGRLGQYPLIVMAKDEA